MATGSQGKISPRKFSEKIALLNKKEREANANFEQIIKEVQATRSQQPAPLQYQHQADYSHFFHHTGREGAEADFERPQSSSLDRDGIEEVYKNLMSSVGQYDEEQEQRRLAETLYTNSNNSNHNSYNNNNNNVAYAKAAYRPASAGMDSGHRTQLVTTTSSINPIAPQHQHYQQQASAFAASSRSSNLDGRQPIDFIPCEQISKDNFSGHLRPTYGENPTQTHQQMTGAAACRARVISFGSATNYKYLCTNNSSGQPRCSSNSSQFDWQANSTGDTEHYLKEPTCDRSRLKSCSDPALHISPTGSLGTVGASSNRMDFVEQQMVQQPQPEREEDVQMSIGQPESELLACDEYPDKEVVLDQMLPCEPVEASQLPAPAAAIVHSKSAQNFDQIAQSRLQLEGSQSGHSNMAYRPEVAQFNSNSLSNLGGPLPGIKICAIEDGQPKGGPKPLVVGAGANNEPSSRDSSLPDISNLRFGSNSGTATPDGQPDFYLKDLYAEDPATQGSLRSFDNSCQALDGSWASGREENLEDIDMGGQLDSSTPSVAVAQPTTSLQSAGFGWQASAAGAGCQLPAQGANQRVGGNLSASECGLTANRHHHNHQAQGALLIGGPLSDPYNNNIMRSKSHSNIDYLAKHSRGQRQANAGSGLNQNGRPAEPTSFDSPLGQHFSSQFGIQTAGPAGWSPVTIRRISDLRAHHQGSSTSPHDSSSNLNSPQSEQNSPGSSSTTEQYCDNFIMLPGGLNPAPDRTQGVSVYTGRGYDNPSQLGAIPAQRAPTHQRAGTIFGQPTAICPAHQPIHQVGYQALQPASSLSSDVSPTRAGGPFQTSGAQQQPQQQLQNQLVYSSYCPTTSAASAPPTGSSNYGDNQCQPFSVPRQLDE